MPVTGGQPEKIADYTCFYPSISPDGTQILSYIAGQNVDGGKIALFNIDGGDPVRLLDCPDQAMIYRQGPLAWALDGKALLYVKTERQISNIWWHPLDGSLPRKITDFKSDVMTNFSCSQDGKFMVVSRFRQSRDLVMMRNFETE